MVGERKLVYHKYEDESNIFQKTQAWSINLHILEQVDLIVYQTLKAYYVITRVRALEFGVINQFANTEQKAYIPIIYWDKRKILIDPVENRRRNLIGDSWYEKLDKVINSEYMSILGNWIRNRRTETIIYPDESDVFNALKYTHFRQVKVVILGQDPYTDGSANGLSFAFKDSSKKKPSKSLDLIFKEVETDIYKGLHLDFDVTLKQWSEQGVLLLNTILTVEKGKPNSHKDIGWQRFTKKIIYDLLVDDTPKVFMLWGNDAKDLFFSVVNQNKDVRDNEIHYYQHHFILTGKHPAADLYNKDQFGITTPSYPNTFLGGKYFSQANEFLVKNKRKPIIW